MSKPKLQPTIIAQISDLHIKSPGELAYGKVDTAKALERCVAELNALEPRPDLVVVSGDLVDTPTPGEYEHLWRLLAPLKIPFIGVPGNHDARDLMRAAFPDWAYAKSSGPLDQARTVGPLDIILLDSHVPAKPHGTLEASTLQWLDATLASSRERPALLFLHHPPFRTGITHMDVQDLFNADELAAIVRKHPRVRIVAAGHVHRAADDICRDRGDHLPGAEPRRRSRHRRIAPAIVPRRAAGVPPACVVSGWRGRRQPCHPSRPDRRLRRPASVFRGGWEVAVAHEPHDVIPGRASSREPGIPK